MDDGEEDRVRVSQIHQALVREEKGKLGSWDGTAASRNPSERS